MDIIKNFYQYTERSNNFCVSVIPFYLEDESFPDQSKFIWAYQIRIVNEGKKIFQLKNRTWLITDESGQTEIIEGDGVVGENPIIKPGGNYEYTSFVSLKTSSGMMRGVYQMVEKKTNEYIKVTIPLFSLDIPGQVYSKH